MKCHLQEGGVKLTPQEPQWPAAAFKDRVDKWTACSLAQVAETLGQFPYLLSSHGLKQTHKRVQTT